MSLGLAARAENLILKAGRNLSLCLGLSRMLCYGAAAKSLKHIDYERSSLAYFKVI